MQVRNLGVVSSFNGFSLLVNHHRHSFPKIRKRPSGAMMPTPYLLATQLPCVLSPHTLSLNFKEVCIPRGGRGVGRFRLDGGLGSGVGGAIVEMVLSAGTVQN